MTGPSGTTRPAEGAGPVRAGKESMMRTVVLLAGVAAILASVPAGAGESDKVEPWQFKATKNGKPAGRYDFSVVTRETGVFAVSMAFPDPKAIGKKRPGRPEIRTYAELDAKGLLGRFKRWKARGKAALYWMAFVFEGTAKIRSENEDGKKSKVTDLGPVTEVAPLEPDQPLLAWLLVRGRIEREIACMGTGSEKVGKARVRKDAATDAGEAWRVEGDCGAFTVVIDAAGEPRTITAEGRSWERLPPPQG